MLTGDRPDPTDGDPDVIVTGSAERTKVLVELARELNLPFVEFNFAFVKGGLDDEMGKKDFPLMQCWLSLGGYESLFSFQRVYREEHESSSLGVADLSLGQYMAHKDYFRKVHRMDEFYDNKASAYSPLDAAGEYNKPLTLKINEMESDFADDGWDVRGSPVHTAHLSTVHSADTFHLSGSTWARSTALASGLR